MLDTRTYVFMDWVAPIANLNSSDTGCLDYETAIQCLTCDLKKNKKQNQKRVFHLKTTSCREYQFKSFTRRVRRGRGIYLKQQSTGLRGVLFRRLCNYKKYILNYRICGRGWKLLA